MSKVISLKINQKLTLKVEITKDTNRNLNMLSILASTSILNIIGIRDKYWNLLYIDSLPCDYIFNSLNSIDLYYLESKKTDFIKPIAIKTNVSHCKNNTTLIGFTNNKITDKTNYFNSTSNIIKVPLLSNKSKSIDFNYINHFSSFPKTTTNKLSTNANPDDLKIIKNKKVKFNKEKVNESENNLLSPTLLTSSVSNYHNEFLNSPSPTFSNFNKKNTLSSTLTMQDILENNSLKAKETKIQKLLSKENKEINDVIIKKYIENDLITMNLISDLEEGKITYDMLINYYSNEHKNSCIINNLIFDNKKNNDSSCNSSLLYGKIDKNSPDTKHKPSPFFKK